MDNQARPDSIVSVKGGISLDGARRLESSLRRRFAKAGSGGPIVLPEDMTITPLQFNSKQLELLARRGVSKTEIYNGFDVPIALGEAKEVNRATLEAALYQHAKLAVLPRLTRYFQRLNAKFCPRFDERLFLWFDNPVPEDEESRAKVQGMELENGSLTINEARAANGRDPVEGGDVTLVPSGMVPLGTVTAPPQVPQDDTTAPDPAADPAVQVAEEAAPTQDIQTAEANVLNGAQIAAATAIVTAVAAGEMPRDAGLGQLRVLFNLTEEQAAEIMGSAGDGSETTPNKPEGGEPAPAPGQPLPGQPPSPLGTPEADDAEPPAKGVIDALVKLELGESTRAQAIDQLRKQGVEYASAFEWTGKRAAPLRTLSHVEKAAHGRNLHPESQKLAAAVRSIFEKQRAEVLRRLAAHIPKRAGAKAWYDELGLDLSSWDADMQKAARAYLQVGFEQGVKDLKVHLQERLGSGREFDVKNEHVKDAADKAAMRFSESTNKATSMELKDAVQKLRQDLAAGILGDGTNTGRELTKVVNEIFDEAETGRAERIALTESARAVHGGQVLAAKESGVVSGIKWLLAGDACEICQGIADKNPDGISLGGSFGEVGNHPDYSDVPYPPAHPNCQCTITEVIDEAALADPGD
jgi:hypothetical protein